MSHSDGGAAAVLPFQSGDSVHVRFDIAGAARTSPVDDSDPRVKLHYKAELRDAGSLALAPPDTGEVAAALAPEDKKWQPRVRLQFDLPSGIIRGRATLLLSITDEVASASAQTEAAIDLAGPVVPDVAGLTSINFRFFRREDDPAPLTVPAYRPGDTVWARFEIVGFKLGSQNRYSVSYGLEALDGTGKSLFRQEVAADVQNESAYPRRFVPGLLSLQLTSNLDRGPYMIRLHLSDRIGGAESVSEHRFIVE